jgi:acyl-CoA thioesterase FadM
MMTRYDYFCDVTEGSLTPNGRLGGAYYALRFEDAGNAFFDALDVGEAYRKRSNHGLFAVDAFLTIISAPTVGDRLNFQMRVLDVVPKAMHAQGLMFIGTELAAQQEVIYLHTSLQDRKTVPFDPQKFELLRTRAAETQAMGPPMVPLRLALKK